MAKQPSQGRVRRRERKNISNGVAHVNSTFNNTMVTIPMCRAIQLRGPRLVVWALKARVNLPHLPRNWRPRTLAKKPRNTA